MRKKDLNQGDNLNMDKMFQHQLSFYNHERGISVAKELLDEHYVVLLSYEEDLLIVNYEWSSNSDRNDVVFMRRDEFEEEFF